MLKAFKKLIAEDAELNEVQQNVFDMVKELQQIDFTRIYEFDSVTGVTDGTFTNVGDPIFVDEGEWTVRIECSGQVVFSSAPTSAYVNMRVVIPSAPTTPINRGGQSGRRVALPLAFAGRLSNDYNESFGLITTGQTIQLQGEITAAGGTVTSRNIAFPSLTLQRRNV